VIYEKIAALVCPLKYLSMSAKVFAMFNDANGIGQITVNCRIRVD
jgi:hypothetical protein